MKVEIHENINMNSYPKTIQINYVNNYVNNKLVN